MRVNKKNVTVEPSFKNRKRHYIYSSIEDSEVVLVFEHNNALELVGVRTFSHCLVF
jgi:hypothetical protein